MYERSIYRELQGFRLGWIKGLPSVDKSNSVEIKLHGDSSVDLMNFINEAIYESSSKITYHRVRKNGNLEIGVTCEEDKDELCFVLKHIFPDIEINELALKSSSIFFVTKKSIPNSLDLITNNIIASNSLIADDETFVSNLSQKEDHFMIRMNISSANREKILDSDGFLIFMGTTLPVFDYLHLNLCSCLERHSRVENCPYKNRCIHCSSHHSGTCSAINDRHLVRCFHCSGNHTSISLECKVVRLLLNRSSKNHTIVYEWIIGSEGHLELSEYLEDIEDS